MKWKIDGTTLTIAAEPGDSFTGNTVATDVIDDPTHGPLLICGEVRVGRKWRQLKVRLADKPDLATAVERWQEAIEAEKRAEAESLEREREAIRGGAKIVAKWHDGEYLSDWEVFWVAGELLAEIGAARYVHAWGYAVSRVVIEAAGPEFTLEDAREALQPQRDAAAKRAREAAEARQAAFNQAARTGEPVCLRSWCESRRAIEGGEWGEYTFACSEWAMPDGTTKETAVNTY